MRRLCYAFSKDVEHHRAAVSLGLTHYNLCLIVKTTRVTPAMAVGVTSHIWEFPELLDALLSVLLTLRLADGPPSVSARSRYGLSPRPRHQRAPGRRRGDDDDAAVVSEVARIMLRG
ncbi:hypothetical protein WMF45_45260 [Sorangium sp. So ce448]